MARIHLFMCTFLVSSVLSSSTTIYTAVSPSPTSTAAPSSSQISIQLSQTTIAVLPGPTQTIIAVQPSPSASAMVVHTSNIQATTSSSVNVTLSTSVAPATSSSVNVTLSTSVAPGPPATKKFKARMTVNGTYKAGFRDSSSAEFIDFAKGFNQTVGKFLNETLTGFVRVGVTKLSNGSVVVDFDIVVQNSSNATSTSIAQALKDGNGTELGYIILGDVSVNATDQPSTSTTSSPTASVTAPSTSATPVPPTSSTKATEIWDKAIDLATPLGTFIIVVVAVALILILLIALICVCCKYAKLKKKTRFPEHMAINDSEWIRSSDDLLMWERNLRASEVKTTNGVSSRPVNDKRT